MCLLPPLRNFVTTNVECKGRTLRKKCFLTCLSDTNNKSLVVRDYSENRVLDKAGNYSPAYSFSPFLLASQKQSEEIP